MRLGVILLPGIITPAAVAYAALAQRLQAHGRVHVAELAVYDDDQPQAGYGLADEFASIERHAANAGFDRFHLVGYSGGGAIVAAYAAKVPDRVASLALMEAAWLGNQGSEREMQVRERFEATATLPPKEAMAEFTRLQLAPGVVPPAPPPGDPPAWMAKRPAGIAAINRLFRSSELRADELRAFDKPVLYMLGGKSSADFHGEIARRAGKLFPDFQLELFPERHHFDPPHRSEPERVADLLLRFWDRAEDSTDD